jgi:hypothetical protein
MLDIKAFQALTARTPNLPSTRVYFVAVSKEDAARADKNSSSASSEVAPTSAAVQVKAVNMMVPAAHAATPVVSTAYDKDRSEIGSRLRGAASGAGNPSLFLQAQLYASSADAQ